MSYQLPLYVIKKQHIEELWRKEPCAWSCHEIKSIPCCVHEQQFQKSQKSGVLSEAFSELVFSLKRVKRGEQTLSSLKRAAKQTQLTERNSPGSLDANSKEILDLLSHPEYCNHWCNSYNNAVGSCFRSSIFLCSWPIWTYFLTEKDPDIKILPHKLHSLHPKMMVLVMLGVDSRLNWVCICLKPCKVGV